jgi:hypothetical protein
MNVTLDLCLVSKQKPVDSLNSLGHQQLSKNVLKKIEYENSDPTGKDSIGNFFPNAKK